MHPHHSARWAAVLLATGLLGGCGSGDATASSSAIRQVATVATGLSVPWGLTFLPDGGALVSERDSGRVLLVTSTQAPTVVGTVRGIDATGEGGLLGLALEPGASPGWL
jgi:glucose/arabinose dehydrogenase